MSNPLAPIVTATTEVSKEPIAVAVHPSGDLIAVVAQQPRQQIVMVPVHNGQFTAAQAHRLQQAITRAIASLRHTGTLPPGLPAGVAGTFNRDGMGTQLELSQIDRYDPAALAAKLPAHTAVLLTCSNADNYFGCDQVDHLASGLAKASARLDYVHLDGVDHFLKEDISKDPANFNQPLPFSARLRDALKTFLASNL